MRWTTGVLVFVLLLGAGALAVGVINRLPHHDVVLPPPRQAPAPPLPPPALGSQWRYTAPQAASGSEAGVEACAKADADIRIGPAADAVSAVRVCVRRGGGYPYGGSIVLGDPHGQFACPECVVTARFDGGPAQSFDATAASTDGTASALFIRDGARLAAALKRSTTATLTVPIRGLGEEDVTVAVAGLKWSG